MKFVLLKLTHDLVSVQIDITVLSESVFFPFHKKDGRLKKKEVFPKALEPASVRAAAGCMVSVTLMPCMQSVAVHDQQVGQLLT